MYFVNEHNLPDYMVHARRVCKKNKKHSWIPSDDSTMGCPYCRGARHDTTKAKEIKPAIERVKENVTTTKENWAAGRIPYGGNREAWEDK